jgi:hypothetical protein
MLAAGVLTSMAPAQADDWGCQVFLCVADPRGAETESACVPPIEKLWTELSHGHPFPTCNFMSSMADLPVGVVNAIPPAALANLGAGTGASNVDASGGYCRADMLYWGGPEKSELRCRATGAINVTINGTLYTRVWWGLGGPTGRSVTEYYGAGSTVVPYDPTQAQQQFLNQQNAASSNGGNH